jgi:hypothetical protein
VSLNRSTCASSFAKADSGITPYSDEGSLWRPHTSQRLAYPTENIFEGLAWILVRAVLFDEHTMGGRTERWPVVGRAIGVVSAFVARPCGPSAIWSSLVARAFTGRGDMTRQTTRQRRPRDLLTLNPDWRGATAFRDRALAGIKICAARDADRPACTRAYAANRGAAM